MKRPAKTRAALAGFLVAVACAGSAQAFGKAFFVSPGGKPSADGSINRPWDLTTGLAGPAGVRPGDTMWLRGGTYTRSAGSSIFVGLRGTSAARITVAQYPGERAVIDLNGAAQGITFTNTPNPLGPAYIDFKSFEITNSDASRRANMPFGLLLFLQITSASLTSSSTIRALGWFRFRGPPTPRSTGVSSTTMGSMIRSMESMSEIPPDS